MWLLIHEWLSPQGVIALGVVYTALQGWRARRTANSNAAALLLIKLDVNKIEIATNSMKDALVAATAEAAHLRGEKVGRADEIARRDAAPDPERR